MLSKTRLGRWQARWHSTGARAAGSNPAIAINSISTMWSTSGGAWLALTTDILRTEKKEEMKEEKKQTVIWRSYENAQRNADKDFKQTSNTISSWHCNITDNGSGFNSFNMAFLQQSWEHLSECNVSWICVWLIKLSYDIKTSSNFIPNNVLQFHEHKLLLTGPLFMRTPWSHYPSNTSNYL